VLAAGPALAHQPERAVVRELVWLKGKRAGDEAPLVLVALGADHHFAVAELKRFPVGEDAVAPQGDFERARLTLQGPRGAPRALRRRAPGSDRHDPRRAPPGQGGSLRDRFGPLPAVAATCR
jgi:hypothetical protein